MDAKRLLIGTVVGGLVMVDPLLEIVRTGLGGRGRPGADVGRRVVGKTPAARRVAGVLKVTSVAGPWSLAGRFVKR